MKCTQYYPVLQSADVPAAAAWFKRHFGFAPMFETDWYVHLQMPEDPAMNLAILDGQHPTIPAVGRGRSTGILLNFEVEDVDAVHTRLLAEGLTPIQPLRSEDFGQRHFILQGPEGVLIDIITPIPPSADFAASFQPDALPQ